MERRDFVELIRGQRLAVEASVSAAGAPQAAVVGIIVTDDLELFFDTRAGSRKCENLRRDGRVAFVIGWDQEWTVQYEGLTDEPAASELARLRQLYFAAFPDGAARQVWPDIVYFRVRPTWVRFSDFRGPEPRIVELDCAERG